MMNNPPRVCILTLSDLQYWRRPSDMATVLAEAGFEVELFCSEADNQLSKLSVQANHTIVRFQQRKSLPTKLTFLGFTSAVLRRALQRDYDIYYGFNWDGFLWAFLCARFFRKRLLFYHSGEYSAWAEHKSPLKLFEVLFARHADLVTCPEPNRADLMQKELKLPRAPTIISNVPLYEPYRESDYLRQYVKESTNQEVGADARFVLHVGRIDYERATELVVESVKDWPSCVYLVFVGTISVQWKCQLDEIIKTHSLSNRVIFHPAVHYLELSNILCSADIGLAFYRPINLNHLNPAPSRIGDYRRAGLAVIGNDVPAVRAVVLEEKLGKLVTNLTPQAIAQSICDIVENPEALEQYKKRSRTSFDAEYNYQVQARPVVEFIETATQD